MGPNSFISLLDQSYEAPFAHIKMEQQRWPERSLILGKSGTQYVAMVTRLLHSVPLSVPQAMLRNGHD